MDPLTRIALISAAGPIIGSAIGVVRLPSERLMYNMLAFAAGVMLAISFMSLIPQSVAMAGSLGCAAGIVVGAAAMLALDKAIPHVHPQFLKSEQRHDLARTSTYLLAGIFLHNFPEGMAIGMGSTVDPDLSALIALAIAIHNVPEGICTAAPFYRVTGSRLRAFLASSSTAIPIIIGYAVSTFVYSRVSEPTIGVIVGATAGLMIFISADELIPASSYRVTNHSTIASVIAGVLFVVLLGL